MDERIWYIYQNNSQMGPFDPDQLNQLFLSSMISKDAYLFKVGWKDWLPIEKCEDEIALVKKASAAPSQPPPPKSSVTSINLADTKIEEKPESSLPSPLSLVPDAAPSTLEISKPQEEEHETKNQNGNSSLDFVDNGIESGMFEVAEPFSGHDIEKTQDEASTREAEKRSQNAPRATVKGEIFLHNNSQFTAGIGVNISSTGIFIETKDQMFNIGEHIKLTVRPESNVKPFNVLAQVIRFSQKQGSPTGYGLKFENIEEEVKSDIQALVDAQNNNKSNEDKSASS